ncbi:hypothetical protein RJT34_27647 [Clitoria ternatea]|uniref:Cyclotide n=1 Tax=Clitoria ternatea TaxID=43366 RepID=A0AAN9FGR9_CLITE
MEIKAFALFLFWSVIEEGFADEDYHNSSLKRTTFPNHFYLVHHPLHIRKEFVDYAEVCFKAFGEDYYKWTIHASAVKLYRQNYQSIERGNKIGLAQAIGWVIPLSQSPVEIDATSRANAFKLDW